MGGKNLKTKQQPDNQVVPPPESRGSWSPPPKEDCYEPAPVDWPLDGAPGGLVVTMAPRLCARTHEMVFYAVTLKNVEDDVSRIDTDHSTVHRHQFFKNSGRQEKLRTIRPLHSQHDVDDTYDESIQDLADNGEKYHWRWLYGDGSDA